MTVGRRQAGRRQRCLRKHNGGREAAGHAVAQTIKACNNVRQQAAAGAPAVMMQHHDGGRRGQLAQAADELLEGAALRGGVGRLGALVHGELQRHQVGVLWAARAARGRQG